MSIPTLVADGNFKVALQNGGTTFRYPFAEKGDGVSFIASRKMRQFASKFIAPRINTRVFFPQGAAFLVDFNTPTPVDGAESVLEWTETYASIPQPRTEYGSISYTQQFLVSTVFSDRLIVEWTAVRDAATVYEYSLNTPLPAVQAPLLVEVLNVIYARGGWGTFTDGQLILAQDTTSSIYMGKIYERKSIYITYNPLIQLA